MKKQTKENINFLSLVMGIIFIIVGLIGSSITIPTKELVIIVPVSFLIIGAVLALMGGLRKWG